MRWLQTVKEQKKHRLKSVPPLFSWCHRLQPVVASDFFTASCHRIVLVAGGGAPKCVPEGGDESAHARISCVQCCFRNGLPLRQQTNRFQEPHLLSP